MENLITTGHKKKLKTSVKLGLDHDFNSRFTL